MKIAVLQPNLSSPKLFRLLLKRHQPPATRYHFPTSVFFMTPLLCSAIHGLAESEKTS
jgi:hypothetical protein